MVFSRYQHIKTFWMGAWSHQCQDTHKKCSGSTCEVQTYFKCSPGTYLCSHCFADHIRAIVIIIILKGPH